MRFEVMSHMHAVQYSPTDQESGVTTLIRITSLPNFYSLKHPEQFVDILELRFDDVEECWAGNPNIDLFSESQLDHILSFADKWNNKCKTMVIHCDAGASRSAAVAICIATYCNNEPELQRLLSITGFFPNKLVLSTFNQRFKNTQINYQYELPIDV